MFSLIYNKILPNRGWFSTPVFVKKSVRDHVIIFIVVGDLSSISLYSVLFVTIQVSSADHVRANSTLKLVKGDIYRPP